MDLRGHQRLGIDSNVLIYLIENEGDLGDRAGALLDAVAAGQATAILSALVLAEVCAGPAKAGDGPLLERVADEILSLENTEVVSLSEELAIDAAVVRAARGLGLSDAIHLATARGEEATAFVTNDRRIKSSPQLEVLYLDEI